VNKELDLWQFVADRLIKGERVMLLVVATSSGSSPGRPGYKMAVAEDGELIGSIGGGLMEVNLVNKSREILDTLSVSDTMPGSEPPAVAGGSASAILDQVHRKNVPHSSGMICSGKQTVIFKLLTPDDILSVNMALAGVQNRDGSFLTITHESFEVRPPEGGTPNDIDFTRQSDSDIEYRELLGAKNDLYIIGGGHCALALSELMSKMDFHVRLFDDRPQLNTIEKNEFADEINVIDSYADIDTHSNSGDRSYVVVMTLGYKTDAVVIRQLIDREFKYFGVLGSQAKMAALFRELIDEGVSKKRLDRIHSPIGLSINSHSPEEIAVSIAAEIISVKNSTD
jgi:xanthine dehydrogenase accessory factor